MKAKITLVTFLFFNCIILLQTLNAQNFVHPGLPFTINDLERMKANRSNVEPWKESWDIILGMQQSSLDYQMQGPAVEVVNKGNDDLFINDVNAALYHALQWYFTKDSAHAELAMSIIEPWATTHKSWGGTSAHLGAAWRGGTLVQACEILRYTYPGWTDELTAKTEDYFREVYWPLFRLPNPLRAANQGANNLMGAMYVAVYINDQEKFDMCIDAYLNDQCGGISNTLPNGENGDTGRDQGHAMGMIGNLATCAEIAWAQGIDLYGVLDNRLLAVHEYWTKYNLGNDVPWIDFGTCYNYFTSIGADGRNPASSDAIPVTELTYGAYAVRKGLSAPYITQYRAAMGVDENTFLFAKDATFMTTAPFTSASDPEFTLSEVTDLTGTNIGSVGVNGNTNYSNGTWTIEGAGTGVYNSTSDSFHYAYKQITGDAVLIAKVNSIENTDSNATAAVVIRESLAANSKTATMSLKSTSGSIYNSRGFYAADGNGSLSDPEPVAPFWIKIERRGDNIVGFVGPDGVSWSAQQNTMFDMSDNFYIGLGVSSTNSIELCTSVFTDVKIGNVDGNTEDLGVYAQIEAEDYSLMSGISTETTTDVSGNEQVASIEAGDWMEYEINVPFSGTYIMDYRVASAVASDITLSSGAGSLEQVTFTSTGGDNQWTTIQSATPFYLSKGTQTIKVLANSNGFKLNWMRLLLECKDIPIIPYVESFNTSGVSLGKRQTSEITILPGNKASLEPLEQASGSWSWTDANDVIISNQRVLVLDNIQKSASGNYKVTYTGDCGAPITQIFTVNVTDSIYIEAEDYTLMNGVTVEVTSDTSGVNNVTNMGSGDWLEYQVNVPYRALYTIDYRVASATNSINFDLNINGSLTKNISFSATGGAQTWETKTQSAIYLEEGLQTLRILPSTNDWNINWLQLNFIELIDACSLPYQNTGFTVQNTVTNWTTGLVNISCQDEVDVLIKYDEIGTLTQSDSFKVYYKLDSGTKTELTNILVSGSNKFIYKDNLSGSSLELIIEAQSSSSSAYYNVSAISIYMGHDESDIIQAEHFDAVSGSNSENTSDTGGGSNMAGIKNGAYLMYSNINLTGVETINARFATKTVGGILEVRTDSPTGELLGTVTLPKTGTNWQTWKTFSGALSSKVGFYDVYLVFKTVDPASTAYVGNINWFELVGSLSTSEVSLENNIVIYPNPVKNIMNITIKQGIELKQVNIYNIQGSHVLSTKDLKIDTSHLTSGMYFVELNTNLGKQVKKVIIE
ncbi:putative secreted protein (Por secretion system target) [Mariniflexile fucanivorans]|uniref:Putative secreted protein (Por secretion system target) n=1 Tax=Mariniflexile fucanivorans TaxID=264023 RepID=A0A4R1RT98_9FLAO|nr:carbohydrate-binding protein [Mariniflexile fucanivorans]TCL69280.1 putative secreted protein (Por secretion system target) [Mariniflexile fucanivorans]